MDNITQKAKFSLEAFKEPRGFIKFISFILAIFAFATISSHSTESKFLVLCEGASSNKTVTYSYGYHYALSSVKLDQDVPLCNASATPGPAYLIGDYSSSAQFFVFVGVIGFLISLAYIIIYTLFDDFYMSSDFMPKIDLVLLAVWTLLWLVSSSAWADGLSHVKYYTDPAHPWLKEVVHDCATSVNQCYPVESGNFATANVSVMFGFLCMFVWGGSVWFVMKETSWFKDRFGGSTAQQQQQFPSSSQGPSTSSGQASGPYSSYPNRM